MKSLLRETKEFKLDEWEPLPVMFREEPTRQALADRIWELHRELVNAPDMECVLQISYNLVLLAGHIRLWVEHLQDGE